MKKRVLPGLVMNTEEDRVNWKRKKYSSELSTIIKKNQKEKELLMGGDDQLLDSDGLRELSKGLNSLDRKLEDWIAEMK